MRILYITQILIPSVGGGEAVFYNLAKSMKGLGHEIHIIYSKQKKSGTYDELLELENIGVTLHPIRPEIESKGEYFILTYRQQLGFMINAVIKGATLTRNEKIEIIHANSLTPIIAAAFLGKLFSLPVVATVHNIWYNWKDWSSQKNVPRITSFVGPIYEKLILKMPVETVHVVSHRIKEQLSQFNSKARISVIYNGIDLSAYQNPGVEPQDGGSYGRFVLFIGRLVIRKNLQTAIVAFSEVAKRLPDAKLLIVGDGPMRYEWEKLVANLNLKKSVIFLGHISSRPKIVDLLASCTALVFPSVEEGFGLVIVESFAMSKPVLVANVKPFDEIVDNGIDGFLVSASEPGEWSEKIIHIFTNKEQCAIMGKKAREKAISKFDLGKSSKDMESLYRVLLPA